MEMVFNIFLIGGILTILWALMGIEKKLNHLTHLFKSLDLKSTSAPSDKLEKKPGANRKPRTEEQKNIASEKRKEWWANKKASGKNQHFPDAKTHKEN